jgi:aspartate aminotransferase-like enzyme
MKARLYAPGPVSVPPQVLEAMSRPLIHHRTPEFKKLFNEVRAKLAQVACVPYGNILILSGSGTAAFEAGLLAAVPRGAKVLGVAGGKFAERWIDMAQTFAYNVKALPVAWGKTVKLDAIREHVSSHRDAHAISLVHSETSTGTLHDIADIAAAVREIAPDMLILVDCVTSLGVAELRPLEWQLDGIFAGSQKGLMTPPGLGFAWLSERVWQQTPQDAHATGRVPSYYLDLHKENAKQAKGETAYTPAVSLLRGLNVALDMILTAGLEPTWARLKQNNQLVLEGASALGCTPFSERPSPAVAALNAPEGIAAPAIVAGFANRNVRIAGGQDDAKPVLFRPSVMGDADTYDALTIVMVLEDVLRDLGHMVPHGAGVAAASRFLHDDDKDDTEHTPA